MYRILELNPQLMGFSSDIDLRINLYHNTKRRLLGDKLTLNDFANAHDYFGIHHADDGWVYREWAPNAYQLYLTGEFNHWRWTEHPMSRFLFMQRELYRILKRLSGLLKSLMTEKYLHGQIRNLNQKIPFTYTKLILKYLINKAHSLGIRVLLDVVHSHAVKNTAEGINMFDGTTWQFFHDGEKGEHPAWKTKCFNYGKDEAITYLQLATELIHQINPKAICIAEDMSGMPGMCLPIKDGGIGFDYRLAMGLPDLWIRTVKEMNTVIKQYVEDNRRKAIYAVTPEEMKRFEKNTKLPKLIAQYKMKNDREHGVSATAGYDLIEEMCISSIAWTDKVYRTYYGIHYLDDHSIKINSVLNSKDVPKEVVKFVIYHELLHRDYPYHDAAFRGEEHKYPQYEEWEHFLYDDMAKFDIAEL